MKRNFSTALRRARVNGRNGIRFAGKELEGYVKAIKIVGGESRFQNAANLIVVAGGLEFLTGAANGKVVDKNLALLEGALGNAAEFTQFQITQTLNADPDADS